MDNTIKGIITANPITVPPDCSLQECIAVMKKQRISCLIVADKGRGVGIYTERDMVRTLHEGIDPDLAMIRDYMNQPVISAGLEINILDASYILLSHKIRHLVITDAEEKVAGILTQTDIIHHLGLNFFLGVKTVGRIMSTNLQTIGKEGLVKDAIAMMVKNSVSCIIVKDKQRPVGILTERDMASLLLDKADTSRVSMQEIMSKPVITVTADSLTHDAIETMGNQHIRRLVVVDESGDYLGLIEQSNIIERLEVEHIKLLRQIISQRENELERTKRALTEKSSYLDNLLHSSMDVAIVAADLDLRVVYFNPVAEQLLGRSQEQVIGRHISEIHDEEGVDPIRVENAFKNVEAHGEHQFSFVLHKPTGEHLIESRICKIKDRRDQAIGYTFMSRDVTSQKQADMAIHTLMETTAGVIGDDFFRSTVHNICEWLNADYCAVGEVTSENKIKTLAAQLDGELLRDRNYGLTGTPCEDIIKNTCYLQFENVDCRFPGNMLLANLEANSYLGIPVLDEDNQPIGILCAISRTKLRLPHNTEEVLAIIAARVSAELGRMKSDQRLQLASHVYENAIEGIMVTSRKGHILAVNPAFSTITGYSAEEVIGQTPRILKSNRHDQPFYKAMWKAILTEGRWKGEIWNRRKSGEIYPERLTISSVKNDLGEIEKFTAVFHDITDLKRSEEKIRHLAYHDPLTELPNRLLFEDRLRQAITRNQRHKVNLAVMFLDIDHFKNLNDSLGHDVGDCFLQQISQQFVETLRKEDTISRLGGDEFTILMDKINGAEDAALVAKKILALFAKPFRLKDSEIFLGTSIGIALYPSDGESPEALIKNADTAMYHAKESGRNNYKFFTKELESKVKTRICLKTDLQKAIEKEQLHTEYQPIIDLQTEQPTGMEMLLRWDRPGFGLMQPREFLPQAMENGLIITIGEWVLRQACAQLQHWEAGDYSDLAIAINLSTDQLRNPTHLNNLLQILDETGPAANRLIVEITEPTVAGAPRQLPDHLRQLRDRGVLIALDDFGTGCSSLTCLQQLPIDILKLDHSFVHEIPQNRETERIASSIIELAKGLDIMVIAEGVETPEQLGFLIEHGCDQAQGHLFSKPLSAEAFDAYLTTLRLGREDGG